MAAARLSGNGGAGVSPHGQTTLAFRVPTLITSLAECPKLTVNDSGLATKERAIREGFWGGQAEDEAMSIRWSSPVFVGEQCHEIGVF